MPLFKTLSPAEEAEYRASARERYTPFEEISGVWHPIYQDECVKMNAEKGYSDDAFKPEELGYNPWDNPLPAGHSGESDP